VGYPSYWNTIRDGTELFMSGQEGTQNEGAGAGVPSEGERRAATRHSSTLRITCYPVGGGLAERRNARVRNVSKTGIGLLLDRHWQSGTALVFELPLSEGIRLTRGRVVHATSQPGGCFLVGCMFDQQLTDEEVQALAR
jgi:hypothetical protein